MLGSDGGRKGIEAEIIVCVCCCCCCCENNGLFDVINDVVGSDKRFRDRGRGGSDEAGDTVVLFGEDAASLPTFEVVQPSNADKKYLELIDKTNTQIYIANNTNNVVANVAIEGKLSNASEVLEQYQMHQLFVIAPYQKKIQDTFNKICAINNLPEEMKLKNYINYIQQGLAQATHDEKPAQS